MAETRRGICCVVVVGGGATADVGSGVGSKSDRSVVVMGRMIKDEDGDDAEEGATKRCGPNDDDDVEDNAPPTKAKEGRKEEEEEEGNGATGLGATGLAATAGDTAVDGIDAGDAG